MDKLVKGIAEHGTIRLMAAVTTDAVEEGVRRHGMSPTASAAFGRVLTGALLLGSGEKDFDRLTVKIEAEGPIGGIVAETTPQGAVRGYVRCPAADLPPNQKGKFDVGGIVGNGMLYVIKETGFDIGLSPEPYVGSVPIISGEIAEDLAHYLAVSEQIPSAVMLGVLLENKEPYVSASGGVIIQMMPDANEHIITMIEDTVRRASRLTEIIRQGAAPSDLLAMMLGEIDFEVLQESEVYFRCNCSRERAVKLIASLGYDEVRSMLSEDKGAVMNCGFCNETYTLDEEDLSEIVAGR